MTRPGQRGPNGRRSAAGAQYQHALAGVGDVEVLQRGQETLAIKQAALQRAVGVAAHRIHGARHATQLTAMVQHAHDGCLVGNGDPQALDVFTQKSRFDKRHQVSRCDLDWHDDGVHAKAGKQRVEHRRRQHLGHGVAQDEINIGAAADALGQSRLSAWF